MIAKCANPECGAPFRYLREGRLFQVDQDPAGHRLVGPFLIAETGPPHRLEHFWLCGACCRRLTLAIDPQRGVVPVPLPQERGKAAA
ncbi:MAG TPA: hypothetical protein VMS96_03160 [Terriglobales bacterium]|nr:hypothetical protein [Terriglobales bacterium]